MSYIFNILRTGAIRETPAKVTAAITAAMQVRPGAVIVELGAGKGEMTEAILSHAGQYKPFRYYAFEINKDQCSLLHQLPQQVIPVCADAFDFAAHLTADVQPAYIICSIPLSFYPKQKIRNLLLQCHQLLLPGGKLFIVFTAPWLVVFLRKLLKNATLKVFKSFPPYLLLVYTKE